MKGLDALLKLVVVFIVAWLVLPLVWHWMSVIMPIACGLLAFAVVIRLLFGKGVKP
jgi:hypothetical protein